MLEHLEQLYVEQCCLANTAPARRPSIVEACARSGTPFQNQAAAQPACQDRSKDLSQQRYSQTIALFQGLIARIGHTFFSVGKPLSCLSDLLVSAANVRLRELTANELAATYKLRLCRKKSSMTTRTREMLNYYRRPKMSHQFRPNNWNQ